MHMKNLIALDQVTIRKPNDHGTERRRGLFLYHGGQATTTQTLTYTAITSDVVFLACLPEPVNRAIYSILVRGLGTQVT